MVLARLSYRIRSAVGTACILSLAPLATGQSAGSAGNDMPIDNGGDVVFTYGDPSPGSPTGTFPPDATSDLYYQIYPGERLMHHVSPSHGPGAMEVDGFLEFLTDTDWSTPPSFYDRTIGPALPASACAENREPAFFQLGFTSEVLISFGSSGFGSPCTLSPSLCSPPDCPPPGWGTPGWGVGISLSTGIVVPADGTAASDLALTYFVTGGMSATPGTGTCGMGDYVRQDVHSLDETQSDLVSCNPGSSELGGYQLAGSGPVPEQVTSMMEGTLTFREAITNVVVDSGTGLGFEQSWGGGGGATNALNIPAGTGQALIAVEHRANQHVGLPCVASMSWSGDGGGKLAPPGIPVGGTNLMISPSGFFGSVLAVWGTGTVSVVAYPVVYTEGIADFKPLALAIPASALGTELYIQSGVITGPGSYASTNVVTSRLGP